jgi:hypothetical protein
MRSRYDPKRQTETSHTTSESDLVSAFGVTLKIIDVTGADYQARKSGLRTRLRVKQPLRAANPQWLHGFVLKATD